MGATACTAAPGRRSLKQRPRHETVAFCTRDGVLVVDEAGASRALHANGVPQRLAWSPDRGSPSSSASTPAAGPKCCTPNRRGASLLFAPMLAPDERHLAFNTRTFDADAWMLEGL